MHIIEFKYSLHRGRPVPIIPIRVKGRAKWYEIWAFIDTGATFSIFEEKEAERLGLPMTEGKRMMVMVGDGSFIPVYLHRVRVRVSEVEVEATVGFSRHLGIGFNLIGRKDIFETFRICLSDKKKIVTFQIED